MDRSTNRFLSALTAVLLLNSAALIYGFLQIHRLQQDYRWAMAVTVPGRAIASRDTTASGNWRPALGTSVLEVFSDFSCPFCRQSAQAIDSVRRLYKDRVSFRYWHMPRPGHLDPAGFKAALAGLCLERDGGPWELFVRAGREKEWNEAVLTRLLDSVVSDRTAFNRCINAEATESALWNHMTRAARVGVIGTPTIRLFGIKLEGAVTVDILRNFIDVKLADFARRSGKRPDDSTTGIPSTKPVPNQ